VLCPGWSVMVRGGPCWHRVGSGVIRAAAGALPGRSGVIRVGTVLGPV
jgi:hypothetical protein